MKQEVRISYRSKGLRPPVYITTSLSDPQWTPKELHSEVQEDGELEFWRQFQAEEGEYQYKFRLGPGDWWALDETKPIVEDESGNRNNVLIVEAITPKTTARSESRQSMHTSRPSTDSLRSSTSATGLKISNAEPTRPEPVRFDDKPRFQQHTHLGPAEPMTPPLTPPDMWDKAAMDTSKFQPFPTPAEILRPSSNASHYSDKSIEEALPADDKKREIEAVAVVDEPSKQPGSGGSGVVAQLKMLFLTIGTWMLSLVGGGMRMTGLLAIAVGLAAMIYKIRDVRNAVIPAILSFFYPSTYGQRRTGTDDASMV